MSTGFKIRTPGAKVAQPSDDALLDVIQSNMQRLPLNDNTSWRHAAESMGRVASIWSGIRFGAILLVGAIILLVFRQITPAEDSEY